MGQVSPRIINSPIEIGLRLLFIFNGLDKTINLDRLVYYNYLLVHSSDIPESPVSLHPDLPNRSCEVLVNRSVILDGLQLLLSKGLIDIKYQKSGIKYRSNKLTRIVAKSFETEYAKSLFDRANWIIQEFENLSDSELQKLFNDHLGKWGSEFSREYIADEKR